MIELLRNGVGLGDFNSSIYLFFIDCDLSLVNTRQILQIDDGTDEGLLHTEAHRG